MANNQRMANKLMQGPSEPFRYREGTTLPQLQEKIANLYGDKSAGYDVAAEYIRPRIPFSLPDQPSPNVYVASPEDTRSAADRQAYDTPRINEVFQRMRSAARNRSRGIR